jgi:hypothetical protein
MVSMTDSSLPASGYLLDRIVLSPTSNPYGAVNANGLYVLDCNGQNVTISACRIVGTLVLLNAGSATKVQGPISWEPATPGYPTLMVATSITLDFDASVPLSESTYGVNFNPAGTPSPYSGGASDVDAADGYPSIINGIIYCGGDLTLATAPGFKGCVIAAGKINCTGAAVNFSYSNASFVNPPPGFTTAYPALYPVAGTWQRVTN